MIFTLSFPPFFSSGLLLLFNWTWALGDYFGIIRITFLTSRSFLFGGLFNAGWIHLNILIITYNIFSFHGLLCFLCFVGGGATASGLLPLWFDNWFFDGLRLLHLFIY